MPFFLIVPVWFLMVIVGVVMLCVHATRRVGVFVITTSTSATIASFVISTIVLLAGLWLVDALPDALVWLRFVVLLGYFVAIPLGGALGAVAAFLLTLRLLPTTARASYIATK